MDNLVITVARGFGSCGKRIAKQIADDLGIHCYENRILMLASQMSGLDEEVFAEVNEKLRNQNVFSAFLFLICKRRKIFASLTFKNLYLHKTAYYLIVIHFRKNYKVFFCFS